MRFSIILSIFVLMLGWTECLYALSAVGQSVSTLTMGIRDLFFAVLGVIIGIAAWSMAIFCAWRWNRIMREVFSPPRSYD